MTRGWSCLLSALQDEDVLLWEQRFCHLAEDIKAPSLLLIVCAIIPVQDLSLEDEKEKGCLSFFSKPTRESGMSFLCTSNRKCVLLSYPSSFEMTIGSSLAIRMKLELLKNPICLSIAEVIKPLF